MADNEESTSWPNEIPTILGLNRTGFQRMEIQTIAQRMLDHLYARPALRDEFKLLLSYWASDMDDWQKKLELVLRGRDQDVERVRSMVKHVQVTLEKEEPSTLKRSADMIMRLWGLPPYDGPNNICRNDGHYAKSIELHGRKSIEELARELGIRKS